MVPLQKEYDSFYDYESTGMEEEDWSHFGPPRRSYGGYRNVSEMDNGAPVDHAADAYYQRFLHEASSYHGFLRDEGAKSYNDDAHYMGFFDEEYAPNMGLFDNHAHHYSMDYVHRHRHHHVANHEHRFFDHHHQVTPYPNHLNQHYAPQHTRQEKQQRRHNRHKVSRHTENKQTMFGVDEGNSMMPKKPSAEGTAMLPEGDMYNKPAIKIGAPHCTHQHDYNNITTEYHQDWLPTRAPGGTSAAAAGRLSSGSLEIPCYDARYQYDGLDKFNHGTIKFNHGTTEEEKEEEEEYEYGEDNFKHHHGARGCGHAHSTHSTHSCGPPRWSSSSSMMGSLSPTLSTGVSAETTMGSAAGGSPLNETRCGNVVTSTPKSSLAPSEKEVVMKYMNMDSKAGGVQVQDKSDDELNFVVPSTTRIGRRLVKPPPGLGFDDEE